MDWLLLPSPEEKKGWPIPVLEISSSPPLPPATPCPLHYPHPVSMRLREPQSAKSGPSTQFGGSLDKAIDPPRLSAAVSSPKG